MRIGIITYHRALNYGAVLQCYALQTFLIKKGHDVYIIDFRQPTIEHLYGLDSNYRDIFKAIKGLHPKSILFIIKLWRNIYRFSKFIRKYLNCTKPCDSNNIPQDFDAYIIGSDQMWSFNCVGGYEPVYFGDFKRHKSSKLYGYAISSCGDFITLLDKEKLNNILKNFTKYSLREYDIAQKLSKITGHTAPICLDPTLLLEKEDWNAIINRKFKDKKYILVYQVRGNKNIILEKAYKTAKYYDYDIIDMSSRKYSINDFITSIKNAEYVFTSSFHATVFSIIFEVPFLAFLLKDGHDERYVNLLHSLDLDNHIFDIDKNIEYPLVFNDDNKRVHCKLNELRQKSIDFIDTI